MCLPPLTHALLIRLPFKIVLVALLAIPSRLASGLARLSTLRFHAVLLSPPIARISAIKFPALQALALALRMHSHPLGPTFLVQPRSSAKKFPEGRKSIQPEEDFSF